MIASEILKAFRDHIEIEKISSIQEVVKNFGKGVLTRVVVPTTIGLGVSGYASDVAGAIAEAKRKKLYPEFEKRMKDNAESSKKLREKIVKKYPEISVVTTKKQLKAVENINPIRRFILGFSTPIEDNAMYSQSKSSPIVVLPKRVNRYILGHELGHHESFKEKQGLDFWKRFHRDWVEPEYTEEIRAWDKSPYAKGKGEEGIRDIALKTYKTQYDADRIARNIGISVAAPVLALTNYDLVEGAAKKVVDILKKVKK